MIDFYVLTLFPELFQTFMNTSIIKKGLEKEAYTIEVKNIRDHALNRYGQVDDLPYGGGAGMVLRPEPVFDAFNQLNLDEKKKKKVLYFSPKGRKIEHEYILSLKKYESIVLICGHYEGIDQRVIDCLVDEEVSLGDFVLTGGEIPAMALIDALIRQIKGVIKTDSLTEESFSNHLLEYKHYTRPAEYCGMKVPDVLLSGHHKLIEEYRMKESIRETLIKRPDLIEKYQFDLKIEKLIKLIQKELKK